MPKDDLPAESHQDDAGADAAAHPIPSAQDGAGSRRDADAGSQPERLRAFRAHAADLAETIARQADSFASYLEESAQRGDSQRRLEIATVEREIAEIERRNAAKLRSQGSEPMDLERLPSLPGTEAPTEPE